MVKKLIPLLILLTALMSGCNEKDMISAVEPTVSISVEEQEVTTDEDIDINKDMDVNKDIETKPEFGAEDQEEVSAMADRITYQDGFYYESLSDEIKERITGISYPKDCTVPYEDLRYMSVLHYDFEGKEISGELICNQAIAQDLIEIFYELYQWKYPIEKMQLIDEYSGDDELSMQDNNSSAFNYRVIAGTTHLSKHARGLAIDINPFYNPYVTYSDNVEHIAPAGAELYADRDADFLYKIDQDDLAYQLFIKHGFTWGGSWTNSKDYQHFEKDPF